MPGWTEEDIVRRDTISISRFASPVAKPKRPNKHNVGPPEERMADGIIFASGKERDYYLSLKVLEKGGRIIKLERQVRYKLEVNGVLVGTIIPDFRITWHDGRVEVHETKGHITEAWRLRHRLFRALYPEIEYQVIK